VEGWIAAEGAVSGRLRRLGRRCSSCANAGAADATVTATSATARILPD